MFPVDGDIHVHGLTLETVILFRHPIYDSLWVLDQIVFMFKTK